MAGTAKRPGYDELAAQVAELRELVRALKAENARLRAELAETRGGGGATEPTEPTEAVSAAAGQRTAPPRWAKANVVRVAGRRPRRPRPPVPGRRREPPSRRFVHAANACPRCAAPLRRGRLCAAAR